MNVKEKAKKFAIKAHMGQVRKSEPDKPMIVHPISVGMLLEEYGYDDAIIAAGYLHDVIEDTKYTIDDIQREFGEEIADLVMSASEPDKSLSWEERKTHTIEETKNMPLRNKVVICADKINNLEDIMIMSQKNGEKDFSSFKRGEDQQRWYFENIYNSLISGEDEKLPIFRRLKETIDIVFYDKDNPYIRDIIFSDNIEYYEQLKKLHAQKVELQRLKALCLTVKPFVIEFCGTPRTGKTTTIHNLYDFLKKGGFKVAIVEEFTTSKYYKEQIKAELDKMNLSDRNLAIAENVYNQLLQAIDSDREVIIVDRSINDRQIWNYIRYTKGDMPESTYYSSRERFRDLSKQLIDFLVITYASPLESLKRDYNSSLALEARSFLNEQNIGDYNAALKALKELLESSVDNLAILDTTNMNMNDVSVEVASQMMTAMRKKYLTTFKRENKIK